MTANPIYPLHPDSVRAISRYSRALERRGLRPRSIDRFGAYANLFARWLGDERSLFEATQEDVERHLDRRGGRHGSGLSARTRYGNISALHVFYGWAIEEELTTEDPTARIRRPKMRRTLPRPIADEDLALALDHADPEMRAILLLAAYQGLRCQEIAGLDRSDVIDSAHPPKLRVMQGKGGHERVVPLHPAVLEALLGLPMRSKGAVIRQPYGTPYKPPRMSQKIREHLVGLGIDATAHQLRHWFGSEVYNASRDIRLTQELMGHQSPQTTAGYVSISVLDAAATVQGLGVARSPREEVATDA